MHAEGERWTYAADADVQAKFWGRTVELIPEGLIRLKFDDGDEYNWTKVSRISRAASLLGGTHYFRGPPIIFWGAPIITWGATQYGCNSSCF